MGNAAESATEDEDAAIYATEFSDANLLSDFDLNIDDDDFFSDLPELEDKSDFPEFEDKPSVLYVPPIQAIPAPISGPNDHTHNQVIIAEERKPEQDHPNDVIHNRINPEQEISITNQKVREDATRNQIQPELVNSDQEEDDLLINTEENDTTDGDAFFDDSGNQSMDDDDLSPKESIVHPNPFYPSSTSAYNNNNEENQQQLICVPDPESHNCSSSVEIDAARGIGSAMGYNNDAVGGALKEPGGLKEVDELARYSIQMMDNNATGWNVPIFASNVVNWGGPHHVPPPPTHQCHSCHVMRRIIHTNGVQDSKLEVHGMHGEPYHALSECWLHQDNLPHSINVEIIEFTTRNPEHVTHFIAQYNLVRRSEGCVLRHDSFMLTTDIGKKASKPHPFSPSPPFAASTTDGCWRNISVVNQFYSHGTANQKARFADALVPSSGDYLPKSNYSAQRQRTGKLKMSELARYFHLPIAEAAKQLRICPTVMKKICRRNGLNRWPYRKIKSIERVIQSLEMSINNGEQDAENIESIRNQIDSLRKEQARLYGGFISLNIL